MREVLRSKSAIAIGALIAATLGLLSPAHAQDAINNAGFSLPGVSLPSGSDEVRAADGTSCRSAVGGNGAYLDVGMIGKQSATDDNAYYGRVVIPLGKSSKRLDCASLYELEVERLKLELELAKAGMGRQQDPSLDTTETSSLNDAEAEPEEVAAVEPVEDVAPEPVVKKKKNAKKPTKTAKVVKSKVGNADWDDEGWSTDGRQTN